MNTRMRGLNNNDKKTHPNKVTFYSPWRPARQFTVPGGETSNAAFSLGLNITWLTLKML